MDKHKLKSLITKCAGKYGISPEIVFGICMQESKCNPLASRYEKHYRWLFEPKKVRPAICSVATEEIFQKTSWGLMQVMGAVYREYGLRGWLCGIAANPEAQLDYGCKHLARQIKRWGLSEGILAYNAGSPRRGEDGRYVNAYYLENVVKYGKKFSGFG